ncbi:hypothetical protein ABVT39_021491 [Epinephelus coioides]
MSDKLLGRNNSSRREEDRTNNTACAWRRKLEERRTHDNSTGDKLAGTMQDSSIVSVRRAAASHLAQRCPQTDLIFTSVRVSMYTVCCRVSIDADLRGFVRVAVRGCKVVIYLEDTVYLSEPSCARLIPRDNSSQF